MSEPLAPGTPEITNGESEDVATTAESDETSLAKRSRSTEVDDEGEAAGKRVKLAGQFAYEVSRGAVADLRIDSELVSEAQ